MVTGADPSEPSPTDQAFRCETRVEHRCVVVTIVGEIDMATAPAIQDALCRAVADSDRDVVADLARVDFIDSSGIQAILVAQIAASERGLDLIVRAASSKVLRVFDLLGLTDQLMIEIDAPTDVRGSPPESREPGQGGAPQ